MFLAERTRAEGGGARPRFAARVSRSSLGDVRAFARSSLRAYPSKHAFAKSLFQLLPQAGGKRHILGIAGLPVARDRNCQEDAGGRALPIHHDAGLARDFATLIDVVGIDQEGRTGRDQAVEVGHDSVFPDEGPRESGVAIDRLAHHLAAVVDAESSTDGICSKRPQILDGNARQLQKCMEVRCSARVTREIGKAGDVTAVVDSCGRVPCHAAQVADVGGYAVLPDYGASGAESSHRAIANAGASD